MNCADKDCTILLSIYKEGVFLRDLIASLARQSVQGISLCYRLDGDEVVAGLEERTSAFRCQELLPAKHLGIPATYWSLLERCEDHPYIMLADQDDVWHENKIEMTLAAMQKAEEKWGKDMPILVHSDLRVVDEKLNLLAGSLMKYQALDPRRCSLKDLVVQNNVTGCTVMINRALRNVLKFSNEAVCHDWYIALTAAAFGKIVFINEPLVDYRQHSSNVYGAVPRRNLFQKLLKRKELHQRLCLTEKQAAAFLEQHRSYLSKEQIEILEAWSRLLMEKSYFKRLVKTVRYGFRKNDWLRTLGMWWAL